LEWLCEQIQHRVKHARAHLGKRFPGRVSKQVKTWLREHNQTVQREARTAYGLRNELERVVKRAQTGLSLELQRSKNLTLVSWFDGWGPSGQKRLDAQANKT
jgi:hypothetical protein